jgi:hypothetical protein
MHINLLEPNLQDVSVSFCETYLFASFPTGRKVHAFHAPSPAKSMWRIFTWQGHASIQHSAYYKFLIYYFLTNIFVTHFTEIVF